MLTDFYPEATIENLNETIEKYGVAVLPNVFSSEECDFVKQKIFNHLANRLNITEPDDVRKLNPISGGIIRTYGLPFLKEVLDIKTDPRIIAAFKKIWGGEELTGSLDAINITPPPELTQAKSFFNPDISNLHVDQGSNKLEKCCIQSFINLEPTEHGDGCLSVLTYSHNYFKDFMTHFKINTDGQDWHLLNEEKTKWLLSKGCEFKAIMAPKGSVVFWDSRTVHMGTLPREDRVDKTRWRLLVYTCYTPARYQNQYDSEIKMCAFVNNQCTSHWPYNVRIFTNSSDGSNKNNLRSLTIGQQKLFGLI